MRAALLGLILRALDEIQFGLRDLDAEEIRTLAATWSLLQDSDTDAEFALRHLTKECE